MHVAWLSVGARTPIILDRFQVAGLRLKVVSQLTAHTQTRSNLRLVGIRELLLVLTQIRRVVIVLGPRRTQSHLIVRTLPVALTLLRLAQVELVVGEGRSQLIVVLDRVLAVLRLAGLLTQKLIVLTLIQIAICPRLLLIHQILAHTTTILSVAARCLHLV